MCISVLSVINVKNIKMLQDVYTNKDISNELIHCRFNRNICF